MRLAHGRATLGRRGKHAWRARKEHDTQGQHATCMTCDMTHDMTQHTAVSRSVFDIRLDVWDYSVVELILTQHPTNERLHHEHSMDTHRHTR